MAEGEGRIYEIPNEVSELVDNDAVMADNLGTPSKWIRWSNFKAQIKAVVKAWLELQGTQFYYDSTEGQYWRWGNVDGVATKIYNKTLIGTTDNDIRTDILHGVSDFDKIINCTGFIKSASFTLYRVKEHFLVSSASNSYIIVIEPGTISFASVGSDLQGQPYKLYIEYYI